jgi:hypothetical protein
MVTAVDAVATFPAFTYGLWIAPRVSFCRTIPMHLASDYIHPYKDAGGRGARCRIRIYLPDDIRDAPVVICSELPNNPGGSATNPAEVIAAGVIQANKLPAALVWIEHRPYESTNGGEETFELAVFTSYEVIESTLSGGDADMDRGRYLEAAKSRYRGGLGGWGSVVVDRGEEVSGSLAGTSDIAAWKGRYAGRTS